ncbi:BPSS1780 family membrane protein [Xanthomonas sp. AM6]|uniref:BPSS1780 family membrane protein n=1 Tax=Xanthomonas sp. AM6 TaxID=2982531 RepID=UPI0021DB4C5F|nr:BPSS1780 family membrane protein [Xanthomonas sp. AM6]UYB52361.1 BPSS1780 family membrane protein [Xanthomonas sp. AM6]
MIEIRKLPASAGAEWLLTGIALLRRAPLALGLLGVIWGLAALLALLMGALNPTLGMLAQLLLGLAGPLLFGGLVWAVREVDQGRTAQPAHLLQGVHDGRAPSLLVALLPQVLVGLALGALALVVVGQSGWEQLGTVMTKLNELGQSSAQPDPAQVEQLVATLPAMRILLWLLLVFVGFVAVTLTLFVLAPQVMFDGRGGLAAMRNSLRACLHNLPAMLVFFILAFIAMFALYFALVLVILLLQALAGPTIAALVAQLLLMALAMPALAGAVYAAWKQMFVHSGDAAPAVPPPPSNVFVA